MRSPLSPGLWRRDQNADQSRPDITSPDRPPSLTFIHVVSRALSQLQLDAGFVPPRLPKIIECRAKPGLMPYYFTTEGRSCPPPDIGHTNTISVVSGNLAESYKPPACSLDDCDTFPSDCESLHQPLPYSDERVCLSACSLILPCSTVPVSDSSPRCSSTLLLSSRNY